MKRHSRRLVLEVIELESRCLLSGQGPSAVWLGQDGHDYTAQSATLGGDGIQDIHIALSNLPTNVAIQEIQVKPYGGGEWDYNGTAGNWAAALMRTPGSATADLYVDPYQVETGRAFEIIITFGDGTRDDFYIAGGAANPNLWMPGDTFQPTWVGQDGYDLTGPGPDVGPDGIQDVDIGIRNLKANLTVQSVTVTSSAGETWQYGVNHQLDNNAELVLSPGDATQGDLYLNPDSNMAGWTLTITVNYSDGKSDTENVTAGATDPTLKLATQPLVSLTWNSFGATWEGQNGLSPATPGDVDVHLNGLPADKTIESATLSDEAGAEWYYNPTGASDPLDGGAPSMVFNPTTGDLFFPPDRDESGATLTLTLAFSDGAVVATRFAGGTSDPALLSAAASATSIIAAPGDDLNALANTYGSVHLTAGTYVMTQTLVLQHPVTITADPGATLLFEQAPNSATWTAAIKLDAGHITLDGFAVRFAGPIQWTPNISFGPAVIGMNDNYDVGAGGAHEDIILTHLDLQSPPAASSWEEAANLIRLINAQSGIVDDNTLDGGTILFSGGPWSFVGNNYVGTVPNTYTYGVIAGQYTHDVTVADNHVEPAAGAGKTWRFLVLTQSGVNDVVKDNTVVGVGPMDSDTIPNPNAPEVILTESYRLHFEGMVTSISPDGWVVQVSSTQNGSARTGDVVAILTGPQAGQYRVIAQALGPTTYLLDAPLNPGNYAISITQGGFVNTTITGNSIDERGSSTSNDLMLAGNHFGTKVTDNTILGGGLAFAFMAYATELPDIWGWSHAPFLGAVISGNTIQDTAGGGVLDVSSGPSVKSSVGRTYFSAALNSNIISYSAAFVSALAAKGTTVLPSGITVGDSNGLDPSELVLSEQGNLVEIPAGVAQGTPLEVDAGTVNGQSLTNAGLALPAVQLTAPVGLQLVDDNGLSASDGITSDTRLRFVADPSMAGYEYSLTGAGGSYEPVTSGNAFQPAGLLQGFNLVFVRGYDSSGDRGPVAAIAFVDDTSAPTIVTSSTASTVSAVSYVYRLSSTEPFVPLGSVIIPEPSVLANGGAMLQIATAGAVGGILSSAPEKTTPKAVVPVQLMPVEEGGRTPHPPLGASIADSSPTRNATRTGPPEPVILQAFDRAQTRDYVTIKVALGGETAFGLTPPLVSHSRGRSVLAHMWTRHHRLAMESALPLTTRRVSQVPQANSRKVGSGERRNG